MEKLVLYDLPSKLPGNTWSPNPAKPRFVLGYKNLPFETVWLEFPDIEPELKKIGAKPIKRRDGSDQYTVPVLRDPNTNTITTDSWEIAEYLDKTYPEKRIFPDGSKGLISAFDSAVVALREGSLKLRFLRSSEILNERSREYFIRTRGALLKTEVDEWSPEGPMRDAHWTSIEKDFYGSAKTWYEKVEGKWLMGDTFCYGDIILAAHSFWTKRVFHADEWKRVTSLHDGKWEALLAAAEKECNLA